MLLALLDLRHDGVPHHLAKELFLVREVEIDGALGEAGALGDVLEPGGGEAALAEHRERGVEDLLRPLLGKAAPARLSG